MCQESSALVHYRIPAEPQGVVRFIQEADRQRKLMKGIALLRMLSEKDRRDVSYEVLEDHFLHTRDVSDDLYDCSLSACATCTDVCPAEVKDILNPRIGTEMLTPYRAFFQSKFTEAQADSFRIHPQLLVEWVSNHIAVDEKNNSQRIPVSPEGVWRSRVADSYSRNVFFVALARMHGYSCPYERYRRMCRICAFFRPETCSGQVSL